MLKELIKKQENITLTLFVKKTTEFGTHIKETPEKYAEIISERMNNVLKKNLCQIGFEKK